MKQRRTQRFIPPVGSLAVVSDVGNNINGDNVLGAGDVCKGPANENLADRSPRLRYP
jgi:hypothetical protein